MILLVLILILIFYLFSISRLNSSMLSRPSLFKSNRWKTASIWVESSFLETYQQVFNLTMFYNNNVPSWTPPWWCTRPCSWRTAWRQSESCLTCQNCSWPQPAVVSENIFDVCHLINPRVIGGGWGNHFIHFIRTY